MKIHPDYQRRVNAVIDYIEEHIDEKLTLDLLAGIACFSEFHFHRVFKTVINESLNDYVRRVRLEKAARLLKQKIQSVTEIAYLLGYSSSANFSRDFHSRFGVSPSKFVARPLQHAETQETPETPETQETPETPGKQDGGRQKDPFQLEFSGIINLPILNVLYLRTCDGYRPERIRKMYHELLHYAADRRIVEADSRTIGIGYDDPDCTPPHRCRYDAFLVIPPEKIADFESPFRYRPLPGGRYASFSFVGTAEHFWPAWDRVFSNWLVGSNWIPENRPHMEYYLPLSSEKTDFHRAELLLPVRPINR